MSDYNITATDDDDEHGERYGVQALTVEYDTRTGRAVEGTETEVDPEAEATTIEAEAEAAAAELAGTAPGKAKTKTRTVRVKVICSCGYYTCGMIRRFGHPEPLYQAEIRPLPSQYARDQRALALHAEAAVN